MKKTKVLFLSYYWPPAGGPGVQRALKFCKYLAEFGIEPIVLTVDERQAHYPMLDNSLAKEVEHVEVHRTGTWEPFGVAGVKNNKNQLAFFNAEKVSFKTKIMRFLRGNLFIPDPRKFWKKHALAKAAELINHHEIKAVITTGPPQSVHLIGLALQQKHQLPWIADFRDPWTDIYFMKTLFRLPFMHAIDQHLERTVLESADLVTCIGESLKKNLASKSKKDLSQHIKVITNGFDEADFPQVVEKNKEGKTIISYVGTLAPKHRIDHFLEALEKVERKDIEFHVVGDVEPQTKNTIQEKLKKTPFHLFGRLPHAQAVKKTCESDLLLLSIFDDTLEGSVPAKLFEYLGSKNPILCLGPANGEAAKIIDHCDIGKTFDFHDVEGIQKFLSTFQLHHMQPNELNISQFTRKNLTRKLADNISQILTQKA